MPTIGSRGVADDAYVYNIAPKLHYFVHLAGQTRDLNPRFSWCYGGEDLVWESIQLGPLVHQRDCTCTDPIQDVGEVQVGSAYHVVEVLASRQCCQR